MFKMILDILLKLWLDLRALGGTDGLDDITVALSIANSTFE